MSYIAVKDLKKTSELWKRLEKDQEMIVTRDGLPCAILVSVNPENANQNLSEIRKARFTAAVGSVRKKARMENVPSEEDIQREIDQTRREKRLQA